MVEAWVYVIGGIIIGVISFAVAYNLISSSVENSQRQNALNQFSNLYSDINTVCLQKMNNSLVRKFSIPASVRVVYTTNNFTSVLPKVVDLIKNKQLSSGKSICMQFTGEGYIRCYPEPPKNFSCDVTMPYMGTLPETEDIWVKVSKILGKTTTREYGICIKKVGFENVNINFDTEKCLEVFPTTTTQPTKAEKKECPFSCCTNEPFYKEKPCPDGKKCVYGICE